MTSRNYFSRQNTLATVTVTPVLVRYRKVYNESLGPGQLVGTAGERATAAGHQSAAGSVNREEHRSSGLGRCSGDSSASDADTQVGKNIEFDAVPSYVAIKVSNLTHSPVVFAGLTVSLSRGHRDWVSVTARAGGPVTDSRGRPGPGVT